MKLLTKRAVFSLYTLQYAHILYVRINFRLTDWLRLKVCNAYVPLNIWHSFAVCNEVIELQITNCKHVYSLQAFLNMYKVLITVKEYIPLNCLQFITVFNVASRFWILMTNTNKNYYLLKKWEEVKKHTFTKHLHSGSSRNFSIYQI